MNSFQETQSDLEVILEFLEEYYRQNTAEHGEKMFCAAGSPAEERRAPADGESRQQRWTCCDSPMLRPAVVQAAPAALSLNTSAAALSDASLPEFLSSRHPVRPPAGGKVRLFHFLFEMLEDPAMAHCVSWVPAAAAGVFRFSSSNKEQVAALWGQRKGNKRPMTYQKMSRALRNYSRSGEIFKVKKKLTYQFSRETLLLLQRSRRGDF
ncbi:transcription factor Spi-B [Centropristis striata]|uniref:transcription factor Spi-B n=1 Tax=Centropristis striata TaxID=184440 RepID=UPI0027E05641|nr:transcription factor Spi-B [Centropristis striata]